MAGTRIQFRQIYMADDEAFVIPHSEGGSILVFESDLAGGGNLGQKWMLRYAVLEPISDEQLQQAHKDGVRIEGDYEPRAASRRKPAKD